MRVMGRLYRGMGVLVVMVEVAAGEGELMPSVHGWRGKNQGQFIARVERF